MKRYAYSEKFIFELFFVKKNFTHLVQLSKIVEQLKSRAPFNIISLIKQKYLQTQTY